jgi:hypothetical protein
MSDLPWLPLAGGALAGLAVALLIVLFVQLRRRATGRDVVAAARAEAATLARTSKADADQLLRSAQADSDRLTSDARRAADSARTDAILAGKMETLAVPPAISGPRGIRENTDGSFIPTGRSTYWRACRWPASARSPLPTRAASSSSR